MGTMKINAQLTYVQYVNDREREIMTIIQIIVKTLRNVSTVKENIYEDQMNVKPGKKEKEIMKLKVTKNLTYP